MKVLKKITELIALIHENYSLTVDKLFDFLLGRKKDGRTGLVYCMANYLVTSGGTVVCLDE